MISIMINLELYRIFVIVANEGNITRASEILCVSQPAITKQIKKLESQLNIKLFERNNSGMKLTVEGNELYFKIKDAIKLISDVENDFKDNRTIRIGTRNNIFSKIFSKGISKYYNSYPNAKLDVHQNNVTSPKTPLERGFRKLENLFDIRPNYKIDVYDMIQETPNGTHVSGASINGDLFLTDTGDMYIHSSYPVNHPKLTTTDLVKATELYDKRFRKTISKIEK